MFWHLAPIPAFPQRGKERTARWGAMVNQDKRGLS
jgi:hypothetical protein